MDKLLLLWISFLVSFDFYSTENSSVNRVTFIQPNKLQFTNSLTRKLEIVINGLGKSKLNFEEHFGKIWFSKLAVSNATIKLTQTRTRSTDNDSDEYRFVWKRSNLDNGTNFPLDKGICVKYALESNLDGSYWYHTFVEQEFSSEFPLITKKIKQQLFNTFEPPLAASKMPMLEHLFYNTHGFALLLSDVHPWLVEIDGNGSLCFSLSNVTYVEEPSFRYFSSIDLRILVEQNIKSVYQNVVRDFGWIKRPKVSPPYSTTLLSITEVKYTNCKDILAHFPSHDLNNSIIFVINWGTSDLTQETSQCFDSAHKSGGRVGLDIIVETGSYTNTNPIAKTVNTFVEKLTKLTRTNQIDSLYCELNDTLRINDNFVEKYPNFVKTQLVQVCSLFTQELLVQSAYKSQPIPGFVQFNVKLDQAGFASLISQAQSLSLAGYQFIAPKAVVDEAMLTKNRVLYIRWIQALVFMPQMGIPVPPWPLEQQVKMPPVDTTVNKIFKDLVNLRQNIVIPTMKKLADNWIKNGEPIIRPMWYAEPDDRLTHSITDQYMLGNDLVIAPLVDLTKEERKIYLPKGDWKYSINQTIYTGPDFIKGTFFVPIDSVPCFVRVG